MNIANFITELFCPIDDALPNIAHHSQAILSPQRTGHHRCAASHEERQPTGFLALAQG